MTAKKSCPDWLRWSAMAACLALVATVVMAVMPSALNNIDNSQTVGTKPQYEREYSCRIDEGDYSAYVGGKVIDKEKLGNKVQDVSVTVGWENADGEWISTEKLRAEIYLIDGVSSDVAVALKFLDRSEAVTTTHYYVMLNPNADFMKEG